MPEESDSRLKDEQHQPTQARQPSSNLGLAVDSLPLAEDVELAQISELVRAFAAQMFARIRQNSHKGLRTAWTNKDWEAQLIELNMNVYEMRGAMTFGVDVLDKAADVAVDAFILWDNWHSNAGIANLPKEQPK